MKHHLYPNLVGGSVPFLQSVQVCARLKVFKVIFCEDLDRISFRWSFSKKFTVCCPNAMNEAISSFSISWVHQFSSVWCQVFVDKQTVVESCCRGGISKEQVRGFDVFQPCALFIQLGFNFVTTKFCNHSVVTVFAFHFMWDFDVAGATWTSSAAAIFRTAFPGWLVGVFRNSAAF